MLFEHFGLLQIGSRLLNSKDQNEKFKLFDKKYSFNLFKKSYD
jgi:hypothetical protein